MKFTLGWLRDYLDTQAPLEAISERLTALGLEVEEIVDRARIYAPFTVAYVEEAVQHPSADRLRLCRVRTAQGVFQVVCGAPNARTGMRGVFAPAGSVIPGTGDTLKKGRIRGEDSEGMLVSEREMGLSDEHDGIIEVADDVEIGTPMAEVFGLDDPLIEIALTPNRPDCAGVMGIARDLAAAGLGSFRAPDAGPVAGAYDSPVRIHLAEDDAGRKACPHFLGRHIRGVRNGPSPQWLQDRLTAVGLRTISALVDMTNYLSLALCRPLHVYDAGKLRGDIRVRLSEGGEALLALNEKTYELVPGMAAICDDSGVIGLGGVMGGMTTGVDENTQDVFVEAAYFDPYSTARTGRTLQIASDARYRFERGIDPEFTAPGMEIATRLILELCGGEPSHVLEAGQAPAQDRRIAYPPGECRRLLGREIPFARQREILDALGFEVKDSAQGPWQVRAPGWRPDIMGKADLVEEIGRIEGYDLIEAVPVRRPGRIAGAAESPLSARRRKARTALAARGMQEAVTWSFTSRDKAGMFAAPAGANGNAELLRLQNPISADLDQMRPSVLAGLVEAASGNAARGFGNVALFEVGPAFSGLSPAGQQIVAAGLRLGRRGERHWDGPAHSRTADLFDARADACAVLEALGASPARLRITREAPDYYHPGRSGALMLGPNLLARFGELHPGICEAFDVAGPVAAFEVLLEAVPEAKNRGPVRPPLALPLFQPLVRDFAFIVDAQLEAGTLIRAVANADKEMIAKVDLFDVYQGKGVEEGRKSLAVAVTIQPVRKTLDEEELETLSRRIQDAAREQAGAELRA